MLQGSELRVLGCFFDSDTRSFVEICDRVGYPTDLGGYYIRRLVHGGWLEKVDRGQYRITAAGKQELALRYGKSLLAPRPRVAVLVVVEQAGRLAVLRRAVQPFIGVAEWPAGEVRAGEAVAAAAQRILEARLGVAGGPRLVGHFRRIDQYRDMIFDDKLFAVHVCQLAAGSIVQSSPLGEVLFCTPDELKALPRPGRALLDIWAYAQAGKPELQERTYELRAEDLSAAVAELSE